jgi:PAS domain-containing protein
MSAQSVIPISRVSDEIIHSSFHGFPGIRWIKDRSGRLTWVSDNYESLTGFDPSAVMHRTVAEIFGSEIGAELEDLDRRARESGKTVYGDVAVPCGRYLLWFEWVTPLPAGAILCSAIPRA